MMIDDDLAHQYVLSIVDRAVTGNAYTGGVCFACGGQPTTGRGEHVIPGWLQKRSKLFNQRLTLLNGTFIPYRSLTVPCCESCNNGFLREIENRIKHSLIKYSPSELATRLSFARWLCKILIGILVKETALPADRRNPIIGNIITPDFVRV